jgi:hypothetical protein
MLVWSIDPGKRMGVASGIAGQMPRIEAVTLRGTKDPTEVQARNLGCFLRDRWAIDKPDLVVVESTDNPAAYPSADSALSQIYCHGALQALAGCYGVRVEKVAASTARVHFCGKASAAARGKGPRTPQQRREDREATNNMVLRRAIALRYLPHGTNDWEKSSAACLFDYAVRHFCRVPPHELVMFGEAAEARS